jgi:TolB-like protein/DNA-binding winged helix-turn-helix (wHTH) protein
MQVRAASREVVIAGMPQTLQPRVMQVLVALARRRGEVVSRDDLVTSCWEGLSVSEDAINRCIGALRRLAEESSGQNFTIETIPRVGYRLTESQASVSPALEVVGPAATPMPTPSLSEIVAPGAPNRWRGSAKLLARSWPFISVAAILITALGVWLAFEFLPREAAKNGNQAVTTASQPVSSSGKPRIAVMPFANLSPDPTNAFFTDGMQEEILTALANSAPGLEVISRTTMMTYKDHPATVAQVTKDLGCTHVLEGSVRREGDHVRLTLQLIDAKSDGRIWSQNYDRQLGSAMTLQSEVAGEVASQLSVKLAGAGQAAAPQTKDPVAYDLYLKARLAAQKLNWDPVEPWEKVEAQYNQAIERDATFLLAYVERFRLRSWMFRYNIDTSQKFLDSIRADLDAIGRLAPKDPVFLVAQASWAATNHEYDRALALLSAAEAAGLAGSNALLVKADIMAHMGLIEEALALSTRAAALDPKNPEVLGSRAYVLQIARRPAEAMKALKLQSAFLPGGQGQEYQAFLRYDVTGDMHALAEFLDRLRVRVPGEFADDGQAWLLVLQHRYAEARLILDRLPKQSPAVPTNFPSEGVGDVPIAAWRGQIDLLLGDSSEAAKDGRLVLEFVADQEVTKYNAWFLRHLTADGRLFTGDKAGALAAADEALALAPRAPDAMRWVIASAEVARIYAWAGAQAKAVAILEELSTSVPGMQPARITRDPMYSVPLANNARFQSLVKKLEAQMAATKLE